MLPFIEINAYHIGNSHLQNNLACEDYSAVYSDDLLSVITISDGHGDKNCFRSQSGAKYACEVTIKMMRKFQTITDHIYDISECNFEAFVDELEASIIEKWKEVVFEDVKVHPFTEQELSGVTKQAYELYTKGQRIEKAYGCTLIAAMCTSNYWLAIQIGDGKCIAAYKDGVFIEPIPVDENCLGNISTSLCNSNAKESFRHFYNNVKPISVFVFSDGIEESFDQAGLLNCLYSVSYWMKNDGIETANQKLDELLPQISEGGSGDDVSIAIMTSLDDEVMKPRQTLEQVYERVSSCESTMNQYQNMLESAKERLIERKRELSTVNSEIEELTKQLQKLNQKKDIVIEENESENKKVEELTEKYRLASEQMMKANKFKESAEKYWFAEYNKIGLSFDKEHNQEDKTIREETEKTKQEGKNTVEIDKAEQKKDEPIVADNSNPIVQESDDVQYRKQIESRPIPNKQNVEEKTDEDNNIWSFSERLRKKGVVQNDNGSVVQ